MKGNAVCHFQAKILKARKKFATLSHFFSPKLSNENEIE